MDDVHAPKEIAPAATSYKTGIPRTHDHVRRPGLLGQITKFHRQRPITWVVGLPGAGKTSLVARWVEESRGKTLWYRFDERDGDGAGLLDALNASGRLPVWSPENQVELAEFARRFFAELAGESLTVVLDDLHRVPDDAPALAMLDAIHDVCGPQLRILAVSRREPPPSLSRGVVGGWLGLVDDLRLTADETKAIAAGASGRALTAEELATADGWLAHVLALAHGQKRAVDRTRVGDFLALELLASLPDDKRVGLRRLAELPEIPDVTGSTWLPVETGRLLTTLAAQRYFVDLGVRFRLHDLLRDALLRINLAADPPEVLRAVRRDLATWIAGSMPEASMQLRALARDTEGALAHLEIHGSEWLARGLHRTVGGWLLDLPEPSSSQARAALCLWRALTMVPLEPEASRPMFAEARRLSVESGDVRRAYSAWCGEVSSYVIQWGAVQGLADLVDELERLHAELGPEPEDLLLRTSADALTALMYGRAEDPRIGHFADATARAVTHAPDAGARISAAAQLLIYKLWWAGDFPGGRALYDAFDAEVSEGEHLAALPRLLWWSCASIVDWQCGSAAECYAKVERGLALAASSGVHVRDFFLLTQGIFCALSQEDWPRAEGYLSRLARTERRHKRLDVMVHHFFRSWYSLCRGDARTALAHAETAWPIAETIGSMFHKVIVLSALAPARLHAGDIPGAEEAYRAQIVLAKAAQNPTFSFIAFCAGAEIALAKKDEARATKQVERMLMVKELGGFHSCCGWRAPMMQDVLSFALQHDIHPEIARKWIREKKIAPPAKRPRGWPMPVRIAAAEGLRVDLEGGAEPRARHQERAQAARAAGGARRRGARRDAVGSRRLAVARCRRRQGRGLPQGGDPPAAPVARQRGRARPRRTHAAESRSGGVRSLARSTDRSGAVAARLRSRPDRGQAREAPQARVSHWMGAGTGMTPEPTRVALPVKTVSVDTAT